MTILLNYENLFKVYETKEELRKKLTHLVLGLDFGDSIFQLTYEANVSVS